MAGTGEGLKPDIELPDIAVLRQLCRAELAARLDSVSTIICVYCSRFLVMFAWFRFRLLGATPTP